MGGDSTACDVAGLPIGAGGARFYLGVVTMLWHVLVSSFPAQSWDNMRRLQAALRKEEVGG